VQPTNGSMVYLGGEQLATSVAAAARASQLLLAAAALAAVALL
jgi:hypothetical protein